MASERVSKLQRIILDSICQERFAIPRGGLIKTDVGHRLGRKGTAFDISFLRSLKNLTSKGLLRDVRPGYDPLYAKWYDRYYIITSSGWALLLKESCGAGFGYLRQMVNKLEDEKLLIVLREAAI